MIPANGLSDRLDRVRRQGKRSWVSRWHRPQVEDTIMSHLKAGKRMLKVAALVGVGTLRRVKREMAGQMAMAA